MGDGKIRGRRIIQTLPLSANLEMAPHLLEGTEPLIRKKTATSLDVKKLRMLILDLGQRRPPICQNK